MKLNIIHYNTKKIHAIQTGTLKNDSMNMAQGGYSSKSGERPKSDLAKDVELIKMIKNMGIV